MADIDCFMAAIRQQESGGNYGSYNRGSGAAGAYQFEPGTWRSAVSGAGLGQYANTSANNTPPWVQDAAAHWLMAGYFAQFGSWYNVAEAWYGGPGAVGHPSWGGGPGYPNVGQYASSVIAIMNRLCGGGQSPPGPVQPPTTSAPTIGIAILQGQWSVAQHIYDTNLRYERDYIVASGTW